MLQVSPNNPKAALIPTGHKPIHPLNNRHREEVLNFLDTRPVHTFIMSSWINDNGLVSSFNRGIFYGCRDTQGALEGVALIGHITLFETKSNAALTAFAKLTQSCASPHAVLGEGKKISRFRSDFTTNGGTPPRIICLNAPSLFVYWLTKRTRRRRLHTGKPDTSSVSTTTRFTSSTDIRQLITYQDHEQTTLLQAVLGFHRGRRSGRAALFPASLAYSSA